MVAVLSAAAAAAAVVVVVVATSKDTSPPLDECSAVRRKRAKAPPTGYSKK